MLAELEMALTKKSIANTRTSAVQVNSKVIFLLLIFPPLYLLLDKQTYCILSVKRGLIHENVWCITTCTHNHYLKSCDALGKLGRCFLVKWE